MAVQARSFSVRIVPPAEGSEARNAGWRVVLPAKGLRMQHVHLARAASDRSPWDTGPNAS